MSVVPQDVLGELGSNRAAPDHVKALARYTKDALDQGATGQNKTALAQRYVETASQVSDTGLDATGSQHSSMSGVTMFVQEAIDKVVHELESDMDHGRGTYGQKAFADKAALVADNVVHSALEEIGMRLSTGGLSCRTMSL